MLIPFVVPEILGGSCQKRQMPLTVKGALTRMYENCSGYLSKKAVTFEITPLEPSNFQIYALHDQCT